MYLGNFIKDIDKKYRKVFFSGLASDSSKVKKNYIFFAIKGNKFDGNDYIKNAIKNDVRKFIIGIGGSANSGDEFLPPSFKLSTA